MLTALRSFETYVPKSLVNRLIKKDGGSTVESEERNLTVMFTDIVGSTKMTQDHGDAAAQEVVRTHNRIVRAALTTYKGREVKHTGDGIMASFANTAQSVEAAIVFMVLLAILWKDAWGAGWETVT